MNDKQLMDRLIELSPYSTIPNEVECKDLFDFVRGIEKSIYNEIDYGYHHLVDSMITVNVIDDDGDIQPSSIVDPRALKDLFNYTQANK